MSTETQKLYRSRDERMIGGVCGGLGEFFGIDPALIRILFVLLTIFGGSGVLVYLVMLFIVPEEPLEGTSSPPVQEKAEPESSAEETEGED
jgi:phage shock protein PspC (stress-responsive transcriptional regulator)